MSLCFNIYPDRYIFNIIEFRIFGVQGIEVNEGRGGEKPEMLHVYSRAKNRSGKSSG